MVDPDPAKPAVTVLELESGRYVERALVSGDDECEATLPFPVRITPSLLARDLHPDD
jgi:hypothetical protein